MSKRQRLKLLYRDKIKPWSIIVDNNEYHAGYTITNTGPWTLNRHYVFNDDTHVQIRTWMLISNIS